MSARFNKSRRASSRMVSVLQRELDLPRFVAATLVGRGIDTPKAARAFLFPSFKHDWLDPYLVLRLRRCRRRARGRRSEGPPRILVFGDFDLDGISATTVLTRGLRELGADTCLFIPKRFEEGYGITAAALERVKAGSGPDFLRDGRLRYRLQGRGEPRAGGGGRRRNHRPPRARGPGSRGRARGRPEDRLHVPKLRARRCGRGAEAGRRSALASASPTFRRDFVDFATLGTVADLMPMLGENRPLVIEGIKMMNKAPRPCIARAARNVGSGSASRLPAQTSASRSSHASMLQGAWATPHLALNLSHVR